MSEAEDSICEECGTDVAETERFIDALIDEKKALQQRAERAEADRDYYRKAIQDFQDGNYAHPRTFRNKNAGQGIGKCCHGTWYFDECESCNSEHFDNALTNGPAAQSIIAELTDKVAKLEANEALAAQALQALVEYADPGFYHACAFMFDRPTGGFGEDFSEDHGDDFYDRPMPGKLAREALAKMRAALGGEK